MSVTDVSRGPDLGYHSDGHSARRGSVKSIRSSVKRRKSGAVRLLEGNGKPAYFSFQTQPPSSVLQDPPRLDSRIRLVTEILFLFRLVGRVRSSVWPSPPYILLLQLVQIACIGRRIL
eukprot:Gb_00467 [translate_table: standard]